MPSTHISNLDSQNRQGSVSLLADSRVDAANLQVMNPEVSHIEFSEVVGSEDNSEANDTDSSPVQQMCIKHEWVDTSHEVMHVRAALPEQHATPPLSVKREADCSLLPNDNTTVDTDSVVLPRIVSTHSLESHIDGHIDRPVTDFQQFVNTDHPEKNPQENLEVVPQKSLVNKSRISNVKPIRIFTSKSINQALKVQQETLSVGPINREEAGGNTNHTDAENVYDQIFSHLVAPMSQSHQDPTQSTVSHESTVSIADMLNDHLTSSDLSSHLNLTQALERVKELEKALNVERFGLQRYMGSDEKIKFYTGFRSVDTLMRFFWRIEPDALTTERSSKWRDAVNFAKETLHEWQDLTEKVIPYMDELFLFLCHVWLGLQPEDLADRFALPSPKDAQFIILRWVYYLHITLPSPTVSTKSTATKSIRLQGKYCNTRVLLHPVKIRAQQKSIRNHLSSTNLTSLIGFSPSGELVFTSDPMLEVASNRELVQNSGILSLLQRGEGVILEDEFVKDDVFSSVGVIVHHLPSFVLPHNATTFKIGSSSTDSHKCHTEVVRLLSAKYVGNITGFKCLHGVVLYPFAHCIKDLWTVCCLLVNYQQGYRSL